MNELFELVKYPCLAFALLSIFSTVLVLSAVVNNRKFTDDN